MTATGRGSERISLEHIEEAGRVVPPVFRDSPQFVSEALSEELGAELLVKVETLNPLRSFKGRGTDYLLHRRPRPGPLVCASAGNFGQGMAWAGRRRGIPVVVFAATSANPLKIERMRRLGADMKLEGDDFDAAKAAARAFAEERGLWFVEDGREPELAEGAGTIALEILRDHTPEIILVPVGNGGLLAGVGRWVKAHVPDVRVVGVCAAGAPAMERSWRAGRVLTTDRAETVADAIAVREPVPEAVADLEPVVDDMLLVDDATLLEAVGVILRRLGVVVEPAGAAGVAAIMDHPERFRGRPVATVLTGGNVTPEQLRRWALADPSGEPR